MCVLATNIQIFSYVSLPEAISIEWFSVSSCLTKAATVRWKPRRSKPTLRNTKLEDTLEWGYASKYVYIYSAYI